jgi:hypothetical protein
MRYSFDFFDAYNGEHTLTGTGDTESAALRGAIEKGGKCYPFFIGGNSLLSHPSCHVVQDVRWVFESLLRGRWRIWMSTGDYGETANIPFTLWTEKGTLLG